MRVSGTFLVSCGVWWLNSGEEVGKGIGMSTQLWRDQLEVMMSSGEGIWDGRQLGFYKISC